MNNSDKLTKYLLYGSIGIILIIFLVYIIYNTSNKTDSDALIGTVLSSSKSFSLTLPDDYVFYNNTYSTSDGVSTVDMGINEPNKQIYISGFTYSLFTDDFSSLVDGWYQDMVDNESVEELSEIENLEINGLSAYSFTYKYYDSNNIYFYARNLYVHGDNYDYIIYFECQESDVDEYNEVLLDIVKSFAEV